MPRNSVGETDRPAAHRPINAEFTMRRIALFFVTTVAIIVLLFSYKTSGPGPSLQASTAGGAAHIVSGPAVSSDAVTTSAPPPDPATAAAPTAVITTEKARGHKTASPKVTAGQKATVPSKTITSPKASARPTQTAPVVVDGAAVDTDYGPVQVEVTIANKKITKVTVPQYPAESGRDAEINSYAIPQLVAEVMSAQSATIDAVSGATYTTQGFQTSLQSALDAANFGK
jgi:uncharacterized protein with FMN-binding domain